MQQNAAEYNQPDCQVHAALTRAKKPQMPHSQVLTAAGVLRAGCRIPAASGRSQRAAGSRQQGPVGEASRRLSKAERAASSGQA
jgi:hypothetical protein